MTKVLQIAFQLPSPYAVSVTSYSPCANSQRNASTSTTEIWSQKTYHSAGVLSNLYVLVTGNGITATSTVRTRKNGGNGGQSVSIGNSTVGEFEDTTNTDTIADGDEVNYQIVIGASGSSLTLSNISTLFDATSGTVIVWAAAATAGAGFATASTNNYMSIAGSITTGTTTEDNANVQVHSDGTWKNMFVYVSANTRASSSTAVQCRKNNGNAGSLAVSVGASATGIFEETANPQSIVATDELDYQVQTGGGTGTVTIRLIATEYLTTNYTFTSIVGTPAGVTFDSTMTNRYLSVGGSPLATEGGASTVKADANIEADISKLWTFLYANTLNATSSLTLNVNNSDSTLVVSFGASTTGEFQDTTHTVSVVATDELATHFTEAASSGNIGLENVSYLFTQAAPFIAKKIMILKQAVNRANTY